MKIAVTFNNGEIFQHFGHTEYFKIYNIEDGKIASSEVSKSLSALKIAVFLSMPCNAAK